jgi:energy-coupling factor transport system ATP-binding protein
MPDEGSFDLQTMGLYFAYDPSRPVLTGLSLSIPAGEFVAMLGPNGSGKTTLAKHFNGLLRPTAGQVLLGGQDIRRRSTGELARTVGYVFQNPDHQIFSATTRQELAFGPRNLGFSETEVQRRVEQILQDFHLAAFADRQPASLSFGLRRKISIASVLVASPRVLILDEPTTGLDWKNTTALIELLQEYHRQGNTILLITHDMRLVADHVPRCLVLHNGQVLAHCNTRLLFKDPQLLSEASLALPQIARLAARLSASGFGREILTVEDFCAAYQAQTASQPPR